ncbi:MAG: hypothetical protein ACXVCY_13160 [Pseudobdellovibrionaceae bacterium]
MYTLKRSWAYAALFFTVAGLFFAYRQGLDASSYIIDDQSLIQIPQLQNKNLFSFIENLFKYPEFHIDFYPLRDLSYWIDIHLFGAKTSPTDSLFIFRVHNFILFYFLTLVIYELIRQLRLLNLSSLFLFFIWVIHPYHSEMVMWVTGRKDLLGLLFSALFLFTFLKCQEYQKKISVPLVILNLLSLLGACWSKTIISPVSLLAGAFLLVTIKNNPEKIKKSLWASSIIFISVWFAWSSRSFYSTINDMRFSYTWDYRLIGLLASLGRMLTGWFLPQVNAIDVFNWGDWAYRNAKFIPAAILFIILLSILLWRERKNTKPNTKIYIALFVAAYLPISTLLFPHRNFYSVRYFEFPSLFLLFMVMEFARKRTFSTVLPWAFIGCLIAQYYEIPHWQTPAASVAKALSLDPTNPSLRSEFEYFGSSKKPLEECKKKIKENSLISENGDLCWFDIMRAGKIDWESRSREIWLEKHAERHSELFHNSTRYYFTLLNLLKSSVPREINLPPPPSEFLNNAYNRKLYLASLCLLPKSKERDQELDSLRDLFFKHHFIEQNNFYSSLPIGPEKLNLCFPNDLRRHFLNIEWSQTFENEKNRQRDLPGFGDWWLQALREGAPGIRYGCGYKHPNKYDCGSTMDQASMVNLFIELYNQTQEPVFLKEAFLYAKNGNQMCSLSHHSSGPCGDGKGGGTWILSLLKLFLATSDMNVRTALLQQLKLLPKDFILQDPSDFFEIYRSYLLGFLILPESRQEDFFEQLKNIALAKKILNDDQVLEISHFLNCGYKNQCPSSKVLLTLSDPLILTAIEELFAMNPRLSLHFQRNVSAFAEISITHPLSSARTAISQCLQKNLDQANLKQFLLKYQRNEFIEAPKPFYYAQEGDNFAPVMLAAFNQMFAAKKDCAYWGLNPFKIQPKMKLYSDDETDGLTVYRRHLFLLSQIDGLKSRLWLANNTKENLTLALSKTCKLPFPQKLLSEASSNKEHFTTLPKAFNMEQLIDCVYLDNHGSSYPLYP